MTLTLDLLIYRIARQTGLPYADVRTIVNSTLEVSAEQVLTGKPVKLQGLGTLHMRVFAAKRANTFGTPTVLGERTLVGFRFSKKLWESVEGGLPLGEPQKVRLKSKSHNVQALLEVHDKFGSLGPTGRGDLVSKALELGL